MANIGKIVQVIGPVLDVKFDSEKSLPNLLNALVIKQGDKEIVAEVAQHVGGDTVRCISMSSTDGLVRGMEVVDTGAPITVPVGDATLGRIFNVLGQPVDGKPAPTDAPQMPIHRPAPEFEELQPTAEILETGIKVVDLLAPYLKGGKIGLFGGAGVGKYQEVAADVALGAVLAGDVVPAVHEAVDGDDGVVVHRGQGLAVGGGAGADIHPVASDPAVGGEDVILVDGQVVGGHIAHVSVVIDLVPLGVAAVQHGHGHALVQHGDHGGGGGGVGPEAQG